MQFSLCVKTSVCKLPMCLQAFAFKIACVYCQCQNYRTEVEEYEGTVIYRTLLFYNSVFLGRYEKTYLNLLLTFFVAL